MIPVVIVGVALMLGRFDPAPHRTGGSTDDTKGFAAPTPPSWCWSPSRSRP